MNDILRNKFVDLHVHLRGTIGPRLASRLAERNKMPIPQKLAEMTPPHKWRNFTEFLTAYDDVASVVKTAKDLEEVAYDYLSSSASDGAIYIEFMLSPPDLIKQGLSFDRQLKALEAAWTRSKSDCGIESRLIVTAVRHHGPEAAMEIARMAASAKHPYVVGFGLAGDETQFETERFISPFNIAKDAGLKLTAHSGEHRPAKSVSESIRLLSLDRVGHGVRAVEDEHVLADILEKGVGLEICVSSNLSLGLYQNIEEHPLRKFISAGIAVSLGTDDPAFFGTSPAREYDLAEHNCVGMLDVSQKISEAALGMAFCDEQTRKSLLARLQDGS